MSLSISTSSFSCSDTEFDLYIAAPESQDHQLPAICVAHAWDGLNAPIEGTTRRVAELGYVAVAVDLYGQGVRGDLTADNSHLMNPLIADRSLLRDRLMAGYAAIRAMGNVDATRVGAIGYCFGGLCVLDLARMVPDGLQAVVSFHGVLTAATQEDTKPIQANVLIEHGWDDPMATPEDFLACAAEMSARKADWQAHVHGGVVHAFTFEGANMPESGVQYNEAADRRSWDSMIKHFAEAF